MSDNENEFAILHALRIKGMASQEQLADATGVPSSSLESILDGLTEREAVKHRVGRMSGYLLTSSGTEAHAHLLPDRVNDEERRGLNDSYEVFVELNGRFKELCTRWQIRPDTAGESQPNDHSDAEYDSAILNELQEIHDEVVSGLTPAGEACPRFNRYATRFGAALGRLHGGDTAALTKPLSDSYHDVWMELHQDFLLTLGRERHEADGY